MTVEPFPLIDLSGPPEARGRSYGARAADRIRRGLGHYQEQLARLGLDRMAIRRAAHRQVRAITAFDDGHSAEIRGIAEGAGVEVEDIVLLNARTEILRQARRGAEAAADGCTGAVLLPEATRDGRLLHGQNWDWKVECVDTAVVLRIRQEHGPDYLTFTEAGGLARSGLNAAGIGLTANNLESDRDGTAEGVPLPLIRRRVLESADLALAIHAVRTTPKTASNNMMLSHAEGFAVSLECAPDESFALQPQDGILVHANHWLSPAALARLRDTGLDATPDSLYRQERVRSRLATGRPLDITDLRDALFDEFGSPWSVCRPPRKGLSGNLTATVAMVLLEPARGEMQIAPLPAVNRRFTFYRLDGTPAETAPLD
ncbi:C45 family peptidase [Inquilinus sp. Marseille-Q2685]|uniref:C45 family autoproteolytic acyltransferase/hydolase n=1 Tax=Inquilinus sp. Marseille-Q2685 TaxID=2866581 RepID=UPI001CE43A30|nr:C45 family peptidase [Inquilinus sp. Marseille-Q2685]